MEVIPFASVHNHYFDGLVQDCTNSIIKTELLQSCTKPLIYPSSGWEQKVTGHCLTSDDEDNSFINASQENYDCVWM